MHKQKFYQEHQELKQRFDSLEPELAVTISDPDMDVEGYIVVWNTDITKGGKLERSGKGGTRITETVSLDEVKMLAHTMALKNAAAGLKLGGAKSGLKANPDSKGFEKKYRRFVELSKPYLFENGGIFGGFGFDIGARPEHPIWACDELGSLNSFTGKPIDMGGTDYDVEGIAGLGVARSAYALLESLNIDQKNSSFAVQGLGAMGAAVIRYYSEYGGVLKAISDPKYDGSWYIKNGASQDLIDAIVIQDSKTIAQLLEIEGVKRSDKDQVLYEEIDILFPCAVHNVITEDNVGSIQAKYIVEGANGPSTRIAKEILFKNGQWLIPDFLANPGGIIAAYIELTSDVTIAENIKSRAKVIEAKEYTIKKIHQNILDVMKMAIDLEVEPVMIGEYLAIKRIFSI